MPHTAIAEGYEFALSMAYALFEANLFFECTEQGF